MSHLLDNQLKMLRIISSHVIPLNTHANPQKQTLVTLVE